MTGLRLLAGVTMAAALLVPAACGGDQPTASGGSSETRASAAIPGPYDHDFDIPEGTAARIAAGETVEVIPLELDARVGETIRIVNDDIESHTVGSFYVLAGTTLTYRFSVVGVFEGACSTHSSGEFTLNVTA